MSDATRLDAPIQRGPLMRWQRKAMESGVRNLSVSDCKCERSDGSIIDQSQIMPPPQFKKRFHVVFFFSFLRPNH